MADVPYVHAPVRRGVSVSIGYARPMPEAETPAHLCVVGVAPPEFPWLADLFPHAVVRDTRFRTREAAVEHVSLRSRDALARLPGLGGEYPSRLRDAVLLGLTAGAPSADVLLVRLAGAGPRDLERAEVHQLLDPFLEELPGAIVTLPDLGSPPGDAPRPRPLGSRERRTFIDAAKRLGRGLTLRYQVGLLDAPALDPAGELDLLRGLVGCDVALCGFAGGPRRMAVHGWRSAATAIGGLLVSDGDDVGRAIDGRTVDLPPGRIAAVGRADTLTLERAQDELVSTHESVVALRLHGTRDRAEIVGEPVFRPPVGEWTLPSLRAVKLIHHRIIHAAEGFVFHSADESEAAGLANAVDRALRPYAQRGMIVGAGGEGAPEVRGGVDRIPGEPGLHAILTAQLRPWSRNVSVRVTVRPGAQPALEVS